MNTDLTIRKIYSVFEGEFKPGLLPRKPVGRDSECFVYYLEGEADYIFDGYSITVDNSCFFYLAKGSIYDINVKKNVKFICINFDFEDDDAHKKSTCFTNAPHYIKKDFIKLFHVWNKRNLWSIQSSFSILYGLYAEAVKSKNKRYVKQNHLFSQITSYIVENYTSPHLMVSEIAGHTNISEVHLRRIFKAAANTTPMKYVNFLRLEKAKNMLTDSNFSIREIALAVGFEDAYYFSRLFKKEVGVSPTEYKKRCL